METKEIGEIEETKTSEKSKESTFELMLESYSLIIASEDVYHAKLDETVYNKFAKELSPAEFMVYIVLYGKIIGDEDVTSKEISLKRLEELTGINTSTISQSIKRLEEDNYIIVIRKKGMTNRYIIPSYTVLKRLANYIDGNVDD